MKITSFDQLARKVRILKLVDPISGDVFETEFKELTQAEVNDLLYVENKPIPPIKEFQRNSITQKLEPVYNEEDPPYKKQLAAWNSRFIYRWLLESWQIEIPGDSFDAKVKTLDENLPGWVLTSFTEKLQEMSGVRESEIAYAKKKSLRVDSESETYAPLTTGA